jgi:hypothetical protein
LVPHHVMVPPGHDLVQDARLMDCCTGSVR